jgi:hypothetical protein
LYAGWFWISIVGARSIVIAIGFAISTPSTSTARNAATSWVSSPFSPHISFARVLIASFSYKNSTVVKSGTRTTRGTSTTPPNARSSTRIRDLVRGNS